MAEDTHREIVLIGGPNDGERYFLGKDLFSFSVHSPDKSEVTYYRSDVIAVAGGRVENAMEVFVHQSIEAPTEWIQMLIDGYRKERPHDSSRS